MILPALGRPEGRDFHAGLPQVFDVRLRQAAAADLVVQDEHADTGLRSLNQGGLDLAAQFVVMEHVELEQHVILCLGNTSQNAVKGRVAIDQKINAVVARQFEARKPPHGVVP